MILNLDISKCKLHVQLCFMLLRIAQVYLIERTDPLTETQIVLVTMSLSRKHQALTVKLNVPCTMLGTRGMKMSLDSPGSNCKDQNTTFNVYQHHTLRNTCNTCSCFIRIRYYEGVNLQIQLSGDLHCVVWGRRIVRSLHLRREPSHSQGSPPW